MHRQCTTVQKLQPEHAYLFERHSIAGKTLPDGCAAFRVEGALFFGAADTLDTVLAGSAGCKVVILQMHRLVLLDTTGLLALDELNDKLRQGGRALVLCGAGGDTAKMLVDSQLAEHVGERNVQPDLAAALTRAQELLRTDSV